MHDAAVFKVIVAIPGPFAVTTPVLLTVAIAALLDSHVPLSEHTKVSTNPIHMFDGPVIDVFVGLFTVNVSLAAELHPVLLLVKEKVTSPAEIAVIIPPFVMVATDTSDVLHVPPELGNIEELSPTHNSVSPVILIEGLPFTVNAPEAKEEHPVDESVNVKDAAPELTPVIIPPDVIVATAGLLLTQTPPEFGVILVVDPIQILLSPNPLIAGGPLTVTEIKSDDVHPLTNSVKVNVAIPGFIPNTIPELLTVATKLLLLNHIPPVVGLKVVVPPLHIKDGPVKLTAGLSITVTGLDNV